MNSKELVLYWSKKYLEKIGFPYIINWKRDTALAKNFLDQMNNTELIKRLIDYIFELELEYYDISFLLGYNINMWIQEMIEEREIQKRVKKVAKEIQKQIKEKK